MPERLEVRGLPEPRSPNGTDLAGVHTLVHRGGGTDAPREWSASKLHLFWAPPASRVALVSVLGVLGAAYLFSVGQLLSLLPVPLPGHPFLGSPWLQRAVVGALALLFPVSIPAVTMAWPGRLRPASRVWTDRGGIAIEGERTRIRLEWRDIASIRVKQDLLELHTWGGDAFNIHLLGRDGRLSSRLVGAIRAAARLDPQDGGQNSLWDARYVAEGYEASRGPQLGPPPVLEADGLPARPRLDAREDEVRAGR